MLDLKFIRNNPDKVKEAVKNKNEKVNVDEILELDAKRRDLTFEGDNLKNKRNEISKEVGKLKKAGKDASSLMEEVKGISDKIKIIDEQIKEIDEKLSKLLLWVPNVPHHSVPIGKDETANKVVKEWGEKKEFSFKPKDHLELGEMLGILDMKRASKISGSGFAMFTGLGARLERALINFMIDVHIEKHGYEEIFPPFLVNRQTMTGTGQLPKLDEDMYCIEFDDLFLIPTAEVPMTNIYSGEILDVKDLPIYKVAYTPCFRREAGSYGKETRGLTRVHQFDKVEMVKFTLPETSYEEHEKLLQNAEEILQMLGLPYHVKILCTGDLSFAGAKCYDIEVWAPGVQKYLEVSSCSNFEDFQARRANIRFKRDRESKPEFVHTLNASGLALPRTVIAILETCQQPDGSIVIPEVLREYMKTSKISLK